MPARASVQCRTRWQGGDDVALGGEQRRQPTLHLWPAVIALGQAYEEATVASLGARDVPIEGLQVSVGEGLGDETEALAAARLDDTRHQQAIEQQLLLTRPDESAQGADVGVSAVRSEAAAS